jgi:hypothetical protein
LLAEVAGQAGIVKPLQTRMIADLNILDKTALCNHNTSTFVATNEWELSDKWPVIVEYVQVGMADTWFGFQFQERIYHNG